MLKLFLLIILALICLNAKAQTADELLFPDSEIVNKAKAETTQVLLNIKDSLELNIKDSLELKNKEIRLRKFKLKPCDQLLSFMSKTGMFADAADFLAKNTCTGIYSFQHITNRNGSHYLVDYFFNEKGEIVDYKILFLMVIP